MMLNCAPTIRRGIVAAGFCAYLLWFWPLVASGQNAPDVTGPYDLRVTRQFASAIQIEWNDNVSNEDGFLVYRRDFSIVAEPRVVASLPANTTSFLDWRLMPGPRRYYYSVVAFNAAANAETSELVEGMTLPIDVLRPGRISRLTSAYSAVDGGIVVTWEDQTRNAEGYRLFRAIREPDDERRYEFEEIARLSYDAKFFTDEDVRFGCRHAYRLEAYNEHGTSITSLGIGSEVLLPRMGGEFVGISLEHDGIFYALMEQPNRVVRFDLGLGEWLESAPLVDKPVGLVVVDENVFVATTHEVMRLERDGTRHSFALPGSELPEGDILSLLGIGSRVIVGQRSEYSSLDSSTGELLQAFPAQVFLRANAIELKEQRRLVGQGINYWFNENYEFVEALPLNLDRFVSARVLLKHPELDLLHTPSGHLLSLDLDTLGGTGGEYEHAISAGESIYFLRQNRIERSSSARPSIPEEIYMLKKEPAQGRLAAATEGTGIWVFNFDGSGEHGAHAESISADSFSSYADIVPPPRFSVFPGIHSSRRSVVDPNGVVLIADRALHRWSQSESTFLSSLLFFYDVADVFIGNDGDPHVVLDSGLVVALRQDPVEGEYTSPEPVFSATNTHILEVKDGYFLTGGYSLFNQANSPERQLIASLPVTGPIRSTFWDSVSERLILAGHPTTASDAPFATVVDFDIATETFGSPRSLELSRPFPGPNTVAALSPDGKRFMNAGVIVDTVNLAEEGRLNVPEGERIGSAVWADNDFLYTVGEYRIGSEIAVVHRWNTETGEASASYLVSGGYSVFAHKDKIIIFSTRGGKFGITTLDLELNPLFDSFMTPGSPTDFAVVHRDATSIGFQWKAPAGVVVGYEIVYVAIVGDSKTEGSVRVTSEQTSVTISGLRPSTTYEVRLRALGNTSASIVDLIASTRSENAQPAPEIAELSASKVTLNWTNPVAAGGTYTIERWNDMHTVDPILLQRDIDPGSTSFVDLAVEPEMTYRYRVAPDSPESIWVPWIELRTPDDGPLGFQDTPSRLNTELLSDRSIDLSWDYESTRGDGLIIERREGDGEWIELARVDISTDRFRDPVLNPGRSYSYRIRSYDLESVNPHVEQVLVETPAEGGWYTGAIADDSSGGVVYLGFSIPHRIERFDYRNREWLDPITTGVGPDVIEIGGDELYYALENAVYRVAGGEGPDEPFAEVPLTGTGRILELFLRGNSLWVFTSNTGVFEVDRFSGRIVRNLDSRTSSNVEFVSEEYGAVGVSSRAYRRIEFRYGGLTVNRPLDHYNDDFRRIRHSTIGISPDRRFLILANNLVVNLLTDAEVAVLSDPNEEGVWDVAYAGDALIALRETSLDSYDSNYSNIGSVPVDGVFKILVSGEDVLTLKEAPTDPRGVRVDSVSLADLKVEPVESPAIAFSQPSLNQSNGLFESLVQISNPTPQAITVSNLLLEGNFEIAIPYNASEVVDASNAKVDFQHILNPGDSVDLILQFAGSAVPAELKVMFTYQDGQLESPSSAFQILRVDHNADGTAVLEFASEPRKQYEIQYSSDGLEWEAVSVLPTAAGNRIHWNDSGPPVTSSHPNTVPIRLYRVRQK